MSENNRSGFDFSKIGKSITNLNSTDFFSNVNIPSNLPSYVYEPIKIYPKSTVQYKIQEQTKLLTEQSQKQIESLNEQNKQLAHLIEQQEREITDSKNEIVQNKRQNTIMLWVTIIACLAAVVSAVVTVLMATGVI